MLFTFLIILCAFIFNLVLPWWSVAIPGIVLGYMFDKSPAASFGMGFLGVFLLWGVQAGWTHYANNGILGNRIAEMLSIGSPLLLILATAIIGGLVSGLAVMTGSLLTRNYKNMKSG